MYVLSAIRSSLYAIRATSDEIALYICRDIITYVGRALQISPFMQNKANFLDDQMNVTSLITVDYENKSPLRPRKNKPNTNPIKANFQKAQMNVTTFLTKDYENKSNCALAENKPNSKPIKANLPDDQMNVNKVLSRDYENNSNCKLCENKANTKPNKANLLNDQMNVTSFLTKDYENIANCALAENKPNTKPIQSQTKPILTPAQVNIIPLRFASQKRSRGGDLRLSQSVNMSIIIERVELLLQNNGVPESKGRF